MTLLRRFLLPLLLIAAFPAAAAPVSAPTPGGWLYEGSDIPPDPAWSFGALPNGVRYAIRRNANPPGQVSIRVRIDAGSLHEEDHERGWAHFVEHMAFRANRDFADREARHLLERLGVSFGSDSNATTGTTQTVYQLDLPNADPGKIDLSLNYIAEMLDSALFETAAVEAERKIVLAEKERRAELSTRMLETSWPLFFAGLKLAERDPIGTAATLGAATPDGLRAFYERWYRPERATIIMVGDADPAVMEQAIARHFGGWQGSGPAPAEPDYGSIATPDRRATTLAYAGAPHSASLIWLRPYGREPNSKAREQDDLARSLAARIVNRRFEASAREQAAFVAAGISERRQTNVADTTSLTVNPRDGKWREALAESFAIIADATASPPSEAEIARELSNLRSGAVSALAGEQTIRSPQRAQQLVAAIDGNSVVASASTSLAMIDEFAPLMTPDRIGAAMRHLFSGAGPRMALLSPDAISLAEADAALAVAERAGPATRRADRQVSFDDLPALGPEGREVSRQRIEDMDVTIVRFANGSTLTFKQTDFEKGSVAVSLRFGAGVAGLSADRPSLHALGSIVTSTGLADIDLDGVERLLTGRRIAMSFGLTEDAAVMRGATNAEDLADQLRLLATKIAYPRWDESLFARMKTGILQSYDLTFASASSRAARELSGFTRPGDRRWAPLEKELIQDIDPARFQAFFDPLIAAGPIEAIIVGDVDIETAVGAMRRTIAALPVRPAGPAPRNVAEVRPPEPNPQPAIFTHQGDPSQAFALVGWSTFGGVDRIRERRALSLAANLFRTRLFERFREAEGASYAPSAASSTSENFPAWGIFYAASELRPENADAFFRAAREIVADLAAAPVAPDEFERAKNPVKSGIERRLKTNAYWLEALEGWTAKPELIEQTRTFLDDYSGLTAEEVRAAIAAHVTDAGDWSMLVLPAKAKDGVD